MADLELKKRYAALYKAGAGSPAVVEVGPLRFLMIDGTGPAGAASGLFQDSTEALLTLAYQVKFAARRRGLAYQVMPLEGLYPNAGKAGGVAADTPVLGPGVDWRLMVLLPDEVDGDLVDEVRERTIAKKGLARLSDVRVQTFSEGTSVQLLHVGPYSEEAATVERLLAFASERGLALTGPHHEIHLSDPARTAPEKLRTLLRYGVRRV